jgi:hypothetical protein
MNWFERYGIPGLYFVLLITTLCCTIFGLPHCKDQRDIAIKAFVAALPASVPIGYILVILSQMLYYCDKFPCQVHRKAWKKAWERAENEADKKKGWCADMEKEWWVEAEATILGRWELDEEKTPRGIEKGRWLQEWFTKRFDVLAINSALILATFLGWGLVILGWRLFQITPVIDYRCRIVVLITISFLLVVVLICNKYFLIKQAKHIATGYYENLIKKSDKYPTSSSHNHVKGAINIGSHGRGSVPVVVLGAFGVVLVALAAKAIWNKVAATQWRWDSE